ncbi:MAG TPA: O-methyltransferase [Solirubrobacteraceae bacterium]|nr:O-methyltransferase [Solirubrobacteraceae bacterium]
MSRELWGRVDRYIERQLLDPDEVLEQAVAASSAAGLPAIAVSPAQGKLLYLIARLHGCRSVLELGTLGGYSTIWLARALLPGGRLVSLELEPAYAEVATDNLARAGLSDRVEVRVGAAVDGLRRLLAEGAGPFDLVFIDADKPGTPDYFLLGLQLVRAGGLIITDNVVRGGELAEDSSEDPRVLGMRRFHELLAAERLTGRVSATTIQTVGSKGYDGFTLALVER